MCSVLTGVAEWCVICFFGLLILMFYLTDVGRQAQVTFGVLLFSMADHVSQVIAAACHVPTTHDLLCCCRLSLDCGSVFMSHACIKLLMPETVSSAGHADICKCPGPLLHSWQSGLFKSKYLPAT